MLIFVGAQMLYVLQYCSHPTELPTHEQVRGLLKRSKQKSVACVQLETRNDLLSFCKQKYLPAPNTCQLIQTNPDCPEALEVLGGDYYVIPQALYCFFEDFVVISEFLGHVNDLFF